MLTGCCMCVFLRVFLNTCGGGDRQAPRGAPCRSTHPSPAVTHNTRTPVTPLKVVTVSLGDIPCPRAAQNTHTSHSSECILGSHSLILQHMQTHICIPLYERTDTHKNKMTDQEVPIKSKSAEFGANCVTFHLTQRNAESFKSQLFTRSTFPRKLPHYQVKITSRGCYSTRPLRFCL